MFAYDSFLFFKATPSEAHVVKEVLNIYETLSGQAVNYHKSGISFSASVRRDKQDEIKSILGVSNGLEDRKYLGLPSLVGR